ncbi:2667_t:CDS:2, partial [Paraglomus brasilianum]
CETIAQGFSKLEELKVVEKELQKCTSEQEFNATKSRLARQAEEIERGLQVRTESKLRPLRSELNRLKGNINNQQYKYYEEIKLLKLEQKQIENRMKENKRKTQSEKDPDKKALLLQMIEDDGKLLEDNLKKQKAIPASNLNFDPDKYVSDLIEGMKEAIEKGGRGSGSGSGRKEDKKENPLQNQQQLIIFG